MAILQHNWTGCLAVHASYASQVLTLNQAVKGVNAAKTQGRGAWLKAAATARIRIHTSNDLQPSLLSLHIQDDVLLQQPLADSHIKLAVLPCPQQNTSILVLMPVQQDPATAAPVTFCFSFFDQLDCSSFTTALQAVLTRQQQQQQQQAQHVPRSGANSQQQQQQQHTVAGPVAEHQVQGAALPQCASDRAQAVCGTSQLTLQADARAAVKRFLLDPDFQRLVEEVEAVWDEVEAELEGAGVIS